MRVIVSSGGGLIRAVTEVWRRVAGDTMGSPFIDTVDPEET